jgi:hypothetical protein
MLGVAAPLKWSRDAAGLKVEMPEKKPSEHAVKLAVSFEEHV